MLLARNSAAEVKAFGAQTARTESAPTATAGGDSASGTAKAEGVDYSGTNVQELGIDEPDLLKTDGNRILVVEDQWLHHVDVSGDTAVLTDSLELPGTWGAEMLLEGDRLLVLTQAEILELVAWLLEAR